MEKQIKRLRRVARWAYWLFIADLILMLFVVWLAFHAPVSSVDVNVFVGGVLGIFALYALSLVLDFLADLGQEVENIKWGVNDLRRKAVAISGETETLAAPGGPPVTKS